MGKSQANSRYNDDAVAAADRVVNAAISDLFSQRRAQHGTIVAAPAGAGKSVLVAKAVDAAIERGLRAAVAAPTNEQAFGLVRSIAERRRGRGPQITFVPASDVTLPAAIRTLAGVDVATPAVANGREVIVGTLSKFGDAFSRGHVAPFDILLVDEAYQAPSAKYYAAAGLAPVHLLVGDSGQINPFSTMPDPNHWRGLPENPLQTSVAALQHYHPATPVHRLPITRRLDHRAARVAQVFYPDFCFSAAVLPGVRELRLARRARRNHLDAALEMAAVDGWARVELSGAVTLQADAQTGRLLVDLVARLVEREPQAICERSLIPTALDQNRIAVGVAHNDQKDLLRLALDARGLNRVVVDTANKLQGLEFGVTFVWHPLAGLPEADEFHLDPGRMCVLLTRHRHACVVVGRAGDESLVRDQPPPATAAYLGDDADPVLDGWEVHQAVYSRLERYRLAV